jgi:hypothetical protein
LWPVNSIPTYDYPDDFVDEIDAGNEYVSVENDEFIVKKPKRTLFCSIVHAADSHPDLAAAVVVLLLIAAVHIFFVCQQAKARRLVPRVMQIIKENHTRMVAVDDVRDRLRREGAAGPVTWRFVVAAVNETKGINRVESKYSKPLWSAAGE